MPESNAEFYQRICDNDVYMTMIINESVTRYVKAALKDREALVELIDEGTNGFVSGSEWARGCERLKAEFVKRNMMKE